MSRKLRIEFGQCAGSGKDTACDYLISKHGGVKLSFSEPLYDIMRYAQSVVGIPHSKDRRFLQMVGTEWARDTIGENVWVDLVRNKIKELPDQNIFISDYRFPNENLDGFTKVIILKKRESDPPEFYKHSSEMQMLDCDYYIENNSDLKSFYKELDDLVESIAEN